MQVCNFVSELEHTHGPCYRKIYVDPSQETGNAARTANIGVKAQMEMVVCCVADNLLTAQWAAPAEVPIKTAVAPIV
jgi:hypothetical protein